MNTTPTVITPENPRSRQRMLLIAAGVVGVLLANALISYAMTRITAPRAVAFDMKRTVDAFFDSASQKKLSEEQTKALSNRFNTALEGSLLTYQQRHHVLILVSPAVVLGAPDVTRNIQQDIACRMREE